MPVIFEPIMVDGNQVNGAQVIIHLSSADDVLQDDMISTELLPFDYRVVPEWGQISMPPV